MHQSEGNYHVEHSNDDQRTGEQDYEAEYGAKLGVPGSPIVVVRAAVWNHSTRVDVGADQVRYGQQQGYDPYSHGDADSFAHGSGSARNVCIIYSHQVQNRKQVIYVKTK